MVSNTSLDECNTSLDDCNNTSLDKIPHAVGLMINDRQF